MCGIIGLMSDTPVNQRVYDALHLLQHRGQDAAGIATLDGLQFHFFKGLGLVRDVFRTLTCAIDGKIVSDWPRRYPMGQRDVA